MSMNSKLQQQFEEQLQYLPEINQQALRSFNWAEELIAIGKKHGLPIDSLEDLQIETMLVLVGLVSPEEYPDELATRLAISPAQVEMILGDVNDKILVPIHDFIINGGQKPLSEPGFNPTIQSEIQTAPQNIPIHVQSETTQNPLHAAGIDITTDDSPTIFPETSVVRMGGIPSTIPETKPVGTPLTFQPEQTTSILPEIQPPLSLQKLQSISEQRKKVIDITIENSNRMAA